MTGRFFRTVLALIAVALLPACQNEEQGVAAVPEASSPKVASSTVPGVSYVKFDDATVALIEEAVASGGVATKSAETNELFSSIGVYSMERLFPDAGEFEERTRREGLHRWYIVNYSTDTPTTRADAGLSSLPGVEIAYGKPRIRINDVTDPQFNRQWDLYNTSSYTHINVAPAWAQFTTGNPNVVVSVVDTGIDLDHEDLSANCGPSANNINTVNGGTKVYAGTHGTHVAGTVAAVSHNGVGICGIAGGDYLAGQAGVTLMSCQIFDVDDGNGGGNSASAIKWAADHGAVISQNSWGYSFDFNNDGYVNTAEEIAAQMAAKIHSADKEAVDYFIKYAGCDNNGNQLPASPMKGGVVIFAAGNETLANGAPANYERVIAVGSVTSSGSRADYSNYGDWVDICAPGSSIYSTVPDNGYGYLSGTSMACPHVSGVAALLLSYYAGYGFTNDMLVDKLLSGAKTSHKASNSKVGPLLDAMGSFTYGSTIAPSPVSSFTTSVSGNTITLKFTVPADSDDGKAYGYLVPIGKNRAAVEAFNPKAPAPDGVTVVELRTGSLNAGDSFTGYLEDLDFSSNYYLAVVAKDYSNNYAEMSSVVAVSTTANNPPVITRESQADIVLRASHTYTLYLNVSDPDRHSFKVTLSEETKVPEASRVDENGRFFILFTGKRADAGSYKVRVSATDSYGAVGYLDIPYTILENQAPEKIKDLNDVVSNGIGEKFTYDMDEYFHDPDGDDVTFTVRNSDSKVVATTIDGNVLQCTVIGYGLSRITIVAKDNAGKALNYEFGILSKNPSNPCETFPNPVYTDLNIRTGDEAQTYIRLSNSNGSVLFEDNVLISGFSGYKIDMRPYAPGRYELLVRYSGKEYRRTITKL